MDYGKRIKNIREVKGLKSCYVAEKLGVSPAVYSGIESGRSKLSAEHAAKIADILGVDIKDIFFETKVNTSLSKRPKKNAS